MKVKRSEMSHYHTIQNCRERVTCKVVHTGSVGPSRLIFSAHDDHGGKEREMVEARQNKKRLAIVVSIISTPSKIHALIPTHVRETTISGRLQVISSNGPLVPPDQPFPSGLLALSWGKV